MSKRMKTFLMVCGIVVGAGLLLSIAGAALGGIRGLASVEERVPWISLTGGQQEHQNGATEAFSSINVDSDLGRVEFVQGQTFAVETSYDKAMGAPRVSVENGILNVKPSGKKIRWFNLNLFNLGDHKDTVIKIYYPQGTAFDRVEIDSDIGDVKLNDLSAKTLHIESDAGDVTMNGIIAGELDLRADMGSIQGASIKSSSASIKLNAGDMNLSGEFAGMTKIDGDMGDCTLTTYLPQDSYSIKTQTDLGDCSINGKSVGSTYLAENPAAANHIETNCDTGDTEINFI